MSTPIPTAVERYFAAVNAEDWPAVGALFAPDGELRAVAAPVSPDVVHLLARERGVILAGGGGAATAELVAPFATATGWPVLADPTSGLRSRPGVIAAFDVVLRHERLVSMKLDGGHVGLQG